MNKILLIQYNKYNFTLVNSDKVLGKAFSFGRRSNEYWIKSLIIFADPFPYFFEIERSPNITPRREFSLPSKTEIFESILSSMTNKDQF